MSKFKTKFDRNRIFVLNEPNAPRLNPALANEIGLNESIMLLQIEFWIAISGKEIDGEYWVYQSETELMNFFTFWSKSTISRVVRSLEKKDLIRIGNYNKYKYDRRT